MQSEPGGSPSPAMVTRRFGRVIAAWHSARPPTDREWEEFLAAVRAADLASGRGLVLTAGGAPHAAQRRALMAIVAGHPVPIAVVSDHGGVRFVASLLAMMTKRIRSFSSSELNAAYAHLGLTSAEQRAAEEFVAEFLQPAPS